MNYLQKQLCQLIAIDKTELALNNLMLIMESYEKTLAAQSDEGFVFDFKRQLILLSARIKKTKNLSLSGLLTNSEEGVEFVKINNSLMSLIQGLSADYSIKEYINMMSSYIEVKTSIDYDSNTNKFSDILEEYVIKQGFDHLEMINSITMTLSHDLEYAYITYPFLRTIRNRSVAEYEAEISDISQLAKKVFSPGESIVDNAQLISWQKASPDSWLVFSDQGKIKGFIHVEVLKQSIAEKIINGIVHEGEIQASDILTFKDASVEDYIHIGSIISSMEELPKQRYKTSIHLLYGMVERILDIKNNTGITRIFSVCYPDWKGNHNAMPILKKMGFEFCGKKTIEGDEIYELDIAVRKNRVLLGLFNKVIEYKNNSSQKTT
jgi:hypothetical protein